MQQANYCSLAQNAPAFAEVAAAATPQKRIEAIKLLGGLFCTTKLPTPLSPRHITVKPHRASFHAFDAYL